MNKSKEAKAAEALSPAAPEKITRDDLEAKFRQLTGDVEDRADAAKTTVLAIGAVVAGAVVLGVFLFGRSRGRQRTTVVEVRRY